MSSAKNAIAFICTANLCRSPFAENYLRMRLQAIGDERHEVFSFGTHAVQQLPVPQELCFVAKEFGVDLTHHQSQPLNADTLMQCRFILAMEQPHIDHLLQ